MRPIVSSERADISPPRVREQAKATYRPRNSKKTSEIMRSVRGSDTKPEVLLRKELWARGHRYRKNVEGLPGTPDLVFRGLELAVFVDGDFWHGRAVLESGGDLSAVPVRGEPAKRWRKKINRNIERDLRVTSSLMDAGWTVLRLWASQVQLDLEQAVAQVEAAIDSQRKLRAT